MGVRAGRSVLISRLLFREWSTGRFVPAQARRKLLVQLVPPFVWYLQKWLSLDGHQGRVQNLNSYGKFISSSTRWYHFRTPQGLSKRQFSYAFSTLIFDLIETTGGLLLNVLVSRVLLKFARMVAGGGGGIVQQYRLYNVKQTFCLIDTTLSLCKLFWLPMSLLPNFSFINHCSVGDISLQNVDWLPTNIVCTQSFYETSWSGLVFWVARSDLLCCTITYFTLIFCCTSIIVLKVLLASHT